MTFFVKFTTGIIILPLSVILFVVWPKWEKLPMFWRVLTGIVIVPIGGFLFLVVEWWNAL